jgi:hypothetical protein
MTAACFDTSATTAALTACSPPSTYTYCAFNRPISAPTAAGSAFFCVNSTGPVSRPANGDADSASGNVSPDARNAYVAPPGKAFAEIAADTANRSGPPIRDTVSNSPNAFSTPALTAAGPPSTTIRPGRNRRSSSAVAAGTPSRVTSSTGPPASPAAAAPLSASANTSPEATYATGAAPDSNVSRDTPAATANRSAPPTRSTAGNGLTTGSIKERAADLKLYSTVTSR